jgi:tyrosyl-tRNA synthetase
MTFTLLETKDGKKMGKTQSGAVWLDAVKMAPYYFFQYWRIVDDAEVIKCLKMLTFLPVEEIEPWKAGRAASLTAPRRFSPSSLQSLSTGR